MLNEQELQALAESVLGLSHADETEIVLISQDARLTRFANNYIHQNVAESDVQITVRAALGRRVGVAASNDTSRQGLAAVAGRAVELARLQEPDPYFDGLPLPDGIHAPAAVGYSAATAGYTPEQRAHGVAPICDAAEAAGLTAAGAFSTSETGLGVCNSHGLWRYHLGSEAGLSTVVMGTAGGSGWASAADSDVAHIDSQALAAEAVDIARRAQNPTDLEPGEYPVVLAPDAVADMLSFFGRYSFNGLAVHEGRSFLAERAGQQLMSPGVAIWDDGLDANGLPLPFDFEGVSKQRSALVAAGVPQAAVWDRRAAAMAGGGRQSTGHALPAPNPWGPVPINVFMAPGPAGRDDLLRGISRGVWVTRFWYTRAVHPMDVIVTGMTRDGTFLIENGEITRPVRNLRFTQSYLAAFNDLAAIGRDTKLISDGFGSVRCPALRVNRFNFTGQTKE